MDEYDDEKPDWREIDRRKDSSRQYGRQETWQNKDTPKNRWDIARRKKALDKLFMGDKGTIEHEKLFNRIHKSYGSSSFIPNIKKYVDKYGMPDDVPTLLLILDAKEQHIITDAFDKIGSISKSLSPKQKEDVKRKLSILKMTDKSAEVRETAENILLAIQ